MKSLYQGPRWQDNEFVMMLGVAVWLGLGTGIGLALEEWTGLPAELGMFAGLAATGYLGHLIERRLTR